MGVLFIEVRGLGMRASSVALRVSGASSLGGDGVGKTVALELRGKTGRDLDLFLPDPMMPRKKPLSPGSRSASLSKSDDCAELGRMSLSITLTVAEAFLETAIESVKGALGGGSMPSKARYDPPGATGVSVRIINRRLPGAGLLGAVDGGNVHICSAFSLAKR